MTMPPPDSTRGKVLATIRTAATPPTVDELAAALGLHRNSVQQHVAGLRADGLIVSAGRPTGGRGRPQAVFRPTPRGVRAGGRNYRLLAQVLVEHLATTSPHPEHAAREAGRTWGNRLAAVHDDDRPPVPAVLDELGFEPDCSAESIELRNCPFRELVDSHPGLVCALHAGMLEGLTDGQPGELTLIPFATATTCRVSVTGPAPADR